MGNDRMKYLHRWRNHGKEPRQPVWKQEKKVSAKPVEVDTDAEGSSAGSQDLK